VSSNASSFSVDTAKQFLLSKIEVQAQMDGVVLDEIEKRMFLFSELSGAPDFEANEKFENDYDTKEYETKIAALLRRSFARDKLAVESKREWEVALHALRTQDFYGLVMVDQASIPRIDLALRSFVWEMVPFTICELAVLVAGGLLVFKPSRLGLTLPDWFRLLLLPLVFVAVWYVGKVFGRPQLSKHDR